ncbi:MAG: glucose 1-dehydrogenase [Clostridiales bacterium]|nr:glucose 1-dehydrogenase [Clostridiales bacterium]
MCNRLENKIAIVTGATSGIGEAIVRLFVKEGAAVVFCGRRRDLGEKIEMEIKKDGGEVRFIQGDVTKEEDQKNLVQSCIEQYGRIDILVPNAGISGEAVPFTEISMESFDKIININLRSYFALTQLVVPYMASQGKGSIIMTSSAAVNKVAPCIEPYAASKAGVVALVKCLALEYAKQGIRVNSVAPGTVRSGMVPEGSAREELLASQMPIGRVGLPEEVAYAYLFFAGDESSLCTGVVMPVDGGMSLS